MRIAVQQETRIVRTIAFDDLGTYDSKTFLDLVSFVDPLWLQKGHRDYRSRPAAGTCHDNDYRQRSEEGEGAGEGEGVGEGEGAGEGEDHFPNPSRAWISFSSKYFWKSFSPPQNHLRDVLAPPGGWPTSTQASGTNERTPSPKECDGSFLGCDSAHLGYLL